MDEIVAYACPCGEVRAAHWRPDFCGRCHARFDLGAPVALVLLELDVTTSRGALELSPAYRVEYLGEWDVGARERVGALFGGHVRPPRPKALQRVARDPSG